MMMMTTTLLVWSELTVNRMTKSDGWFFVAWFLFPPEPEKAKQSTAPSEKPVQVPVQIGFC
jgi:hypothetical protein